MLKQYLLLLCVVACAGGASAQSYWHDAPENTLPSGGERRIVPQKFRSVQLNRQAIQAVLAAAPDAFSSVSTETMPVLSIPSPDGQMVRFSIEEASVMAPQLQAKYPEIRCYTGKGINNPFAKIKLDMTPWGFHAMVMEPGKDSWFIDPMIHGNADFYVSYFKKDYLPKSQDVAWSCTAEAPEDAKVLTGTPAQNTVQSPEQGDTKLRRYRLALACTGEYAAFQGGTKPLVLAAMNTTMNRVNGVYETDLGITMQIVANDDQIIYLNASTDPYTNGNGNTMLSQNQTTCTNVIGSANFDIGHVFSTGGGGIAYLGVICDNSYKARGVTGTNSPVGDPFDIDYVAHEMGHQFGANHPFNGNLGSCSGNYSTPDAVEPGSGSTIMAYAGICGANDLQAHSDAYFHANSLQAMTAHAIYGSGNTCAEKISYTNHNPDVNGGADYTIPKSTPFALTAVGTDVDGDTLTYCWEQMDAAITTNPPVSTSTTGPLFRSFSPTFSPTRVFPRLQDIVNNVNPTWEELPSVGRTLNFRVVVRDNDWQVGCTDEDDVKLTVTSNAGPFLVTAPNTNVTWASGNTETVTWDVANTTASPVNCAKVRISLSTDGGYTYPILLADNEPNDGSADIIVPNIPATTTTCRVKVEAVGNVFFDISNANFKIIPSPTFYLATSSNLITACAGDEASFDLTIDQLLNFTTPAQITVSGAPAGSVVSISTNPVTPPGTSTVTISGLTVAMEGTYTLHVEAVAGAVTRNTDITLTVFQGLPPAATLVSPANGSNNVPTNTDLTWDAAVGVTYDLEVSTSPAFTAGSMIFTQTGSDGLAHLNGLTPGTVYYWRILSTTSCGQGPVSDVYAFQAGITSCDNVLEATDLPKSIDAFSVNSVVSTIHVTDTRNIEDVNVNLGIAHSWVGDLSASLVSPAGDTFLLFDRPGFPNDQFGCGNDDVAVTFDSESPLDATSLENSCNATPPALSGIYQPIASLDLLNGKNAQGDWQLIVQDAYEEDGGSLNSWSLSFCFPDNAPTGALLANVPLLVTLGGTGVVTNSNLALNISGATGQAHYILLSLPQHGTLTLLGVDLGIGDEFTQTDIDGGLVVYTNNGDPNDTDSFRFDAIDSNNNAWVHNETFHINVVQNNLAATATATHGILCHDGTDGEITVNASGLDGNYTYALNGGAAQNSNIFSGLSAGTYTVIVTGQFGFTVSAQQIVLDNPAVLDASASVAGNDVTIIATGGTGAFMYSSNGVDFQSDNVFTGLAFGPYTFTVQDENGCSTTVEVVLSANPPSASVAVQHGITCAGTNTGEIAVAVTGGQSPFEYKLNNQPAQSDSVFTGLYAGTYTVVVTDANGSSSTATIILTGPAAITGTADIVLNTISVNASGGTGTLEYSLDGMTFQPSPVFTGLTNGTYFVTVRDENGCTVMITAVVNVPPLNLSAAATGQILCFGDQTGEITVTGTGGLPPYEYRLNNGVYQSGNVFTGLSAGTYMVWVKDNVGTEVSMAVNIGQPTQILVNVSVTGKTATPVISGGTAPYQFASDAPNPDLHNLPNGVYSLTVTDANGCTTVTSFTINVAPLVAQFTTTDATCSNSADGSITISITGGTAPYIWNGLPVQNGQTLSNLSPGVYSITLTDADGTTATVSGTISSPLALSSTIVVNGSTITASGNGGTPPYEYSLNGGAYQSSGTFSNLAPGSYTITVRDAHGCTFAGNSVVVLSSTVEPASAWGLAVSPNPSNGLFTLTMTQAPATLHASVYDAAGRMVRDLDLNPGKGQFSTVLDIREMPNGIYLLRLTDGQNWGGVRLSKVE